MKSKVIVGLRGLARGNIHWGDFPKILNDVEPGLEFIPLEMAGNGERYAEASLTDSMDVIADLRTQLFTSRTHLNKITLVGISLGGMLALKWAEIFPDEIEDIFIINSSLSEISPFYQRLLPKNYFSILTAVFILSSFEREVALLKMTSNKKIHPMTEKQQFQGINFFRQIYLASKIKISKKENLKPTIIFSENDRLVSCECSKKMAREFQCLAFSHAKAGHDLPLDDPQWLAQQIQSRRNL